MNFIESIHQLQRQVREIRQILSKIPIRFALGAGREGPFKVRITGREEIEQRMGGSSPKQGVYEAVRVQVVDGRYSQLPNTELLDPLEGTGVVVPMGNNMPFEIGGQIFRVEPVPSSPLYPIWEDKDKVCDASSASSVSQSSHEAVCVGWSYIVTEPGYVNESDGLKDDNICPTGTV